jgi:hypothetical protein
VTDVKLGVTITGDASGLRSEVKLTRDAMRGLSADAASNAAASEQTRKATEAFSTALKQQTEGVVDLEKAQRDLMEALDAAAGANDKARQAHQGAAEGANQNKSAHQGLFGEILKGVGTVELVKRAWEGLKELYAEVRDATLEMQQSQARLEAVLNRSASASGLTATSVNELAESMSRMTKFDDTALRNAATTVLSFGNVSQEALEKILKLSGDLAATGRGDLEQWATVLTKVGTAPAETLGLLERQFGKIDIATKVAIISAQQMGDVAKANALLFDLVASKVGGVAVTSYKGLEHQLDGTQKAWKRFKEALGEEIFSAKSRDASVFEQALDHMTETFKSRISAMKEVWNNIPPGMLYLLGVPTAAFGAGQPKRAPETADDLRKQIAEYEASIQANPGNAAFATRANASIGQLRQRLYAMPGQIPVTGAIDESAGLSMQSPFTQKPNSLFTSQGSLELAQQQLQAQQQLADQSYQLLQEQIQRELALNDKKHAAGLMSEKEYYGQLADLQEQAETTEVQRLAEAISRQKQSVANASSQVGMARNQSDPDALLAAQKAFDAEKAKELLLEGQLAGAVAKVGTARKVINADEAAADKARTDRQIALTRQFQDSDKSLQQQTSDMQLQYDLLGKTAAEGEVLSNQHKLDVQQADEELKIRRQIEDLARDKGTDHSEEIAELETRLKDLPEAYARAAAAQGTLLKGMVDIRNEVNVATDAAGKFSDFMVQLFTQSGSAAQKFLKLLESIAAELLSVFTRQYTLHMIAAVTGSSAIGAQAAQTGQGTLAGTVANGLGNYLAGGSLIGGEAVAGGFGGAMSAGYTANAAYLAGSAEMAPVYGTFAGEMGGAMAGIQSALAAIPVWGWIALAVIAIGAFLAGKGGGPKTGGSAMGNFDASGTYTGDVSVPGTDNGRFFTPDDLDPQARQAQRAFGAGYFAQLRALGGRAPEGGFTPGIGFDNDPHGSAQSRVSASVVMGGREVYSNRDEGVDDKDVPKTIALEISRGILAGLQNSDLEDGVKAILNMVVAKTATQDQIDAVFKLATEFRSLEATITALSGTPLDNLKIQLKALDDNVSGAQSAFNAALATKDPAQILSAEQTLKQAILDRYNTEINLAMQLKHAIDDLKQAAYEFNVSIDQKIIGAGGHADIAGESLTYATSLRTTVGGNFDPSGQLQSVQRYVGAIDNWYQARRAEIEKDIAQQQQQIQAVAQAEMANNNARIAATQQELQIVQQWKSVLQSSTQMIDQLRISAVNPMSAEQRLKLAQTDADLAKQAYDKATGADKATAAQTYLQKLQAELGVLGEAFQRPSPEYQQIYDQIYAQLVKVQGDAQGATDKEEQLTQQLVDLQNNGNLIAASTNAAMDASNGKLDELNHQYVDYLTWAKGEANRLYAMEEQSNHDALMQLTGGREDIQTFIGQKQKEAVDLLKEIRDGIVGAAAPAGATTPPPGGTQSPFAVPGAGSPPAADGGDAGGGPGSTGPQPKSYVPVTVQIGGTTLKEVLVPVIDARMDQRAPQYKQLLKVN